MPTVPRDRRAGPLDREQQRRQSRAAVLDRVRSGQVRAPAPPALYEPLAYYRTVAEQHARALTASLYPQGTITQGTITGTVYPTWHGGTMANATTTGSLWGGGGAQTIPLTGTFYLSDPSPPQDPVVRTAELSRQMLVAASDPEAAVAETFDALRRDIEQHIMEVHNLAIEDVWRRWSAEIVATRNPTTAQTTIRVAAYPRHATDDTWDGWAQGVERFTGVAATTRSRPTAADVRRNVERNRRDRMIAENRRRAEGVRFRVASRRARELLVDTLDPIQRADLEAEEGFRVIVGDRRYWIAHGYMGNVYEVDADGTKLASYCAHGPSYLPTYDHMLAQKLLLETDEQAFLDLANRSEGYGGVIERLVPPSDHDVVVQAIDVRLPPVRPVTTFGAYYPPLRAASGLLE